MKHKLSNQMNSVEITMSLISGKWKIPILFILSDHARNYGDLLSQIGNISKKVLTENLKELENYHVIRKIDYKDNKIQKTKYELTEAGIMLIPLINEIVNYSLRYKQIYLKKMEENSTSIAKQKR